MEKSSFDFLKRLLGTPGPSGFETAAARVWREEAERFADHVDVDVSGNSIAALKGNGGPRVMLAISHVSAPGSVADIGITEKVHARRPVRALKACTYPIGSGSCTRSGTWLPTITRSP